MAKKRIQKELEDFHKDPDEAFSFGVKEDMDIFHLQGYLIGPKDSPYSGGIFTLDITLPEDYPFKMPKFLFTTKIYHPNINSMGGICFDFHKDCDWSPALTIRKAMASLSGLLSSPDPDEPLVPEIAHIFKTNKARFEMYAREWTQKYAK